MEKKIKIGLLSLIAGVVLFGSSFTGVNAFPAELYDGYDIKGKIVSLEVIEEETSETYGKAKFTLEILKATLKLKGSRHDEIPPIKSGDVIEADSYYKYKYEQPSFIGISASYYNPAEFKEGDMIHAGILYAGLDSTLLSDPRHIYDNYYIYAILLGSSVILITSFAFIVRRRRSK